MKKLSIDFVTSVFLLMIAYTILACIVVGQRTKKEAQEYSIHIIKESQPDEFGNVSIIYAIGKDTNALDFLTPLELDSVKQIVARK